MNLLGIDIGGTKTSVCVGTEEGTIVASQRMQTGPGDSLDVYFGQLKALADATIVEAGLSAADIEMVGISAPGPLNARKGILIAPPNNPGWKDVPVVAKVSEMFDAPVRLENDANAAALAEYRFGEFRGVQDLVYLTFSTGMGAGIIANGRLLRGASDMGGEVGHHCVEPDGETCGCGKPGCFEAYVGGRTVAERLKAKIRAENITTAIVDKAGGDIDSVDHKAFADAAREGDPFAVAEWDDFTERLAQGISNVIMILNPQAVVLGTIAVYEGDFVLRPLRQKLPKYTWKWALDACTINASALGKSIGDLGAIAVALTED
jgi:glucokinase